MWASERKRQMKEVEEEDWKVEKETKMERKKENQPRVKKKNPSNIYENLYLDISIIFA